MGELDLYEPHGLGPVDELARRRRWAAAHPDLLREKLGEAEDATTQLTDELRAAGRPDTDAGDQLRDQLDSSTAELESSFDTLKESAQEVADAPAGEFLQKSAGLASDFAALQATISQTVTTIENTDVGEEARAEHEGPT